MKGGKDEGKPMDPLFPRLHINDADKGGPRAPPRNKMALCEQYDVPSQSLKLGSGSIGMLPLPPSNGCSSFLSQPSSSKVDNSKRNVLSTFGSTPRSSHLTERYYSSYCSGGVMSSASLAKPDQWMLGPANDHNPHIFSSLNSCCTKNPGDESDFTLPSFLQSGKTLDYGNHLDEEKVATTFSLMSSGELHNACLKLLKETTNGDQKTEHHTNVAAKNSKIPQNNDFFLEKKPLFITPFGEKILSEKFTRKRSASSMDGSSHSSPQMGDCNKISKMEEKDCQVGNADKKQEISDPFKEKSVTGLELTPDDIVRVLGERLFSRARRTIVHQQRIFSMQIFELHRLIKVQRLIARSPGILNENNFQPEQKPFIQFPPMNKLLYLTPLDPLPAVSKPKTDPVKSNSGKECEAKVITGTLPLPTINAEKGHIAQQLSPNTGVSTPPPIPTDAKLPPPWCFPPPPGNHWLVPIRSPSEGLIYKPYTGSSFPSLGFMGPPVYGNCLPINLSPLGGPTYDVPAPNENGIGHFYGQSYPCTIPLINATGSNLEVEQMMSSSPGVQLAEFAKKISTGSCKESSPQSALASDCGQVEKLEGDTLSLFPTTPSVQVSKDQSNDQRVQVIKVVPHNRKSAPESAARIFQSIQEERRKYD